MPSQDRVVWSEGMFLRPQHLQQHDRYLDSQLSDRTRWSSPHNWGIRQLEVDEQLLHQGVFAITTCEAIMPDGSLVHCYGGEHRLVMEIQPGQQNKLIYLALPLNVAGADETSLKPEPHALTRWQGEESEVRDSNLGASKSVPVQLAKPRLQLFLEDQLSADYTRIAVARLKESYADGRVELDEHYVGPCLRVQASERLVFFVKETHSLLLHRAQAIASRLSGSRGQRGGTELVDFLLLQLVNRYGALFKHFCQDLSLHPQQLYQHLISLNGEMAAFTNDSKLPEYDSRYQHEDLTPCFNLLMAEIRQSLSAVFEQTALSLALQERRFGVRVAPIQDRALLDQAQFYLAVKCGWSKEQVANQIPTLVKAGGVEQLRELVNLQLPGIQLIPLPVAPRQIPYSSGYTYFQLEKTPERWAHLQKSGGFAFHFSGEVPGLELELWAVKGG